MVKAAFKITFFYQQTVLKFKEETGIKWSIALHGAESWPFRKMDQQYLESF
jgi:hypothetical protein